MGLYDDWTFEENDKLDRENLAQVLTKILKNGNMLEPERNSFVLAIDSKWGTGKTAFIKMWINMLKNTETNSFELVYLNVSQDEEFGDPIIPLVSSIYCKTKMESLKDTAGNIPDIIGDIIESKVGANLKDLTKNNIDSLLDKYSKFQSKKQDLKKILSKYTDKNQLIVFIDELDRCSCGYVLKYLEIIKTYFDVKGLSFVLAMDLEQISNLISSSYNGFANANKYLTKFYDLIVKLPNPNISQYYEYLLSVYLSANKDFDKMRVNISELNHPYKKEIVSNLRQLNTSLRDLNFIMRDLIIFTNFFNEKSSKGKNPLLTYFYIFTLKQIKPILLDKILTEYYKSCESDKEVNELNTLSLDGVMKDIIELWKKDGFILTRGELEKRHHMNDEDMDKIYTSISIDLTGGSKNWNSNETVGHFVQRRIAIMDILQQ